jgi:hypothetical protein
MISRLKRQAILCCDDFVTTDQKQYRRFRRHRYIAYEGAVARQARRGAWLLPGGASEVAHVRLDHCPHRSFPLLDAKDPWPPADLASSTRHRSVSGGKTRH